MSSFLTRQIPQPAYNPTTVHTNVSCDVCGTSPIQGVRYKCASCPNFDMCANCESNENNHDKTHVLLKLRYVIAAEPSNGTALLPNVRVMPQPQRVPISPPHINYPVPHRTD